MKKMSLCVSLILVFILSHTALAADYDVVIYGGTSAAVTTAVQVKKMGKSVVIVSPDKHLGGLTSGGLGSPIPEMSAPSAACPASFTAACMRFTSRTQPGGGRKSTSTRTSARAPAPCSTTTD